MIEWEFPILDDLFSSSKYDMGPLPNLLCLTLPSSTYPFRDIPLEMILLCLLASPFSPSPPFPYIFLLGEYLHFSMGSYGDYTMPILEQDFENMGYSSSEDYGLIFYLVGDMTR